MIFISAHFRRNKDIPYKFTAEVEGNPKVTVTTKVENDNPNNAYGELLVELEARFNIHDNITMESSSIDHLYIDGILTIDGCQEGVALARKRREENK